VVPILNGEEPKRRYAGPFRSRPRAELALKADDKAEAIRRGAGWKKKAQGGANGKCGPHSTGARNDKSREDRG